MNEYRYDAFISYRHLPADQSAAMRLQTLLERHHPPKGLRRLRIFRDESEFSSSSDLGAEIKNALMQSRYLIAVCSEKTQESAWCMEEIRQFKQLRGGTQQILTLLVSGKPEVSIPRPIWPDKSAAMDNNCTPPPTPLSADIRANTVRKSLGRLKTEFLRIAAPLYGCTFDDLYQRHKRYVRRQRGFVAAGAVVVIGAAGLAASAFTSMRADNYTNEGIQYANSGSPQEALASYAHALSLNANQKTAAAGASLLLQDYAWPVLKDTVSGCLVNKCLLPSPHALAGNPDADRYLYLASGQWVVSNREGKNLASLDPDYGSFLGAASGWWAFLGENSLYFYQPETGQSRRIPGPEERSPGCGISGVSFVETPHACMLPDGKALVAYRGLVYLYTFDEYDNPLEIARSDLANIFPEDAARNGISESNEIYPSQDGSLALIANDSQVALYKTASLDANSIVTKYRSGLMAADIHAGKGIYALAYGNPYQIDLMNPGGFFEIYDTGGNLLFSSPQTGKESLLGIAFYPDDPDYLLTWDTSFVHIWNWTEEKEVAAPIRKDSIRNVCFGEDGTVMIDCDRETVSVYALAKLSQTPVSLEGDTGKLPLGIRSYYMNASGPDGASAEIKSSTLTLFDTDGNELASKKLPVRGNRLALSEDFQTAYSFSQDTPALLRIPVDFHAGTIGEIQQLETNGKKVLAIWFGDGWLAAEIETREVLIFGNKSKYLAKIKPQHAGNILSARVDTETGHAVLIFKETTGALDSTHFADQGSIEIWDIASSQLLSSYLSRNRKIDAVEISDGSVLRWRIRDTTYMRSLLSPKPNKEAISFLRSLSCFTREQMPQTPAGLDGRMGNWSVLGAEWDTSWLSPKAPAADTQSVLTEILSAEDYPSASWFDRSDALWQQLLNYEQAYTSLDIDRFYSKYRRAIESTGETYRFEIGLTAYLELMERLFIAYAGDEEDHYTVFDTEMFHTLSDTQSYDAAISQAFRSFGSTILEAADPQSMAEYSGKYFCAWSDVLSGSGTDALWELAEYTTSLPDMEMMASEPMALALLCEERVQEAASVINKYMAYLIRIWGDDDGWKDSFETHILCADILAMRGEISVDVLSQYLRSIDSLYIGIEVSAVSTAAQEAGLMVGDHIVGIDGVRLASLSHYMRMRDSSKAQVFEILRGEEIMTLDVSAAIGFEGRLSVVSAIAE